jgi:hypothetical protein
MSDDTPLPQPPFFLVPNVNNLRDAALFPGSLPTASPPGKVRTGILFRSAEVAKLDTEGWKKVYDIGVGRVFDLRSKPEVDKGWAGIVGNKAGESGGDVRPGWIKGMEEAGVKRDWVPVFEESDYSPERLAERYSKYMGESVEVCPSRFNLPVNLLFLYFDTMCPYSSYGILSSTNILQVISGH